jgi:hypothetical protein
VFQYFAKNFGTEKPMNVVQKTGNVLYARYYITEKQTKLKKNSKKLVQGAY